MNYWQYFGASALSPLPAWEHKPGENCVFDLRPNEIYGMHPPCIPYHVPPHPHLSILPSDLASFGQWYSFSPPDRDPPRPDKQYVQAMKVCCFLPFVVTRKPCGPTTTTTPPMLPEGPLP